MWFLYTVNRNHIFPIKDVGPTQFWDRPTVLGL